jgi:hypothetical protein
MDVAGNEAYLIGALLGRGSIEQVKNGYSLIFRFPYRSYNPTQVTIINYLVENGASKASEIAKTPSLRIENISSRQVSRALQLVRKWHPSHRETRGQVVNYSKQNKLWSIENEEDCADFLEEQEKFKEREISSTDFLIDHIQSITKDMGQNIEIKKVSSSFMVNYLTLNCNISNILYRKLKKEYDLDIGDVYRHMGIPKAIANYNQHELEEFFRGVADATVHFDRAPIWEWMGRYSDNRLWQLRFASVCDNPRFIFDLCQLMQNKLDIPVFIINWAGLDSYRGKRDIFIEVWAVNLQKFPFPLFYNSWKQEHFEQSLDEDERKLKSRNVSKQDIGQLKPCPRKSRKMSDYMKRCKAYFDCPKIPQRLLVEFSG